LLAETIGEKFEDELSSDVRRHWYVVLVPDMANVEICTDEIVTDDRHHRYRADVRYP